MNLRPQRLALGRYKVATLLLAASALGPARADEPLCRRATASCAAPRDVKEYMTQVVNSPDYLKDVPPNEACGSNEPVKVEFEFYLTSIAALDQMLGQITLNGYFRQYWKDPRLAYNSTNDGGCLNTLTMPEAFRAVDHIWTPNLYIDNGVEWTQGGASRTDINPDGSVFTSDEALITLQLNMRFERMPYDSHTVFMELASYSMDSATVSLSAKGGKAGAGISGIGMTAGRIDHPVWLIEDGEAAEGGFSTPGTVVVKDFGSDWDYLTVSFNVTRRPKYLIDHVLLQDAMFLGVCYMGFFVNPEVAPARATMAVIPVLIMRTLANAAFSGLPQLSYSVWIADYLQVSIFLCVLCVVQFAITQYCLLHAAWAKKRFDKLQEHEKVMKAIVAQARDRHQTTLEFVESLEHKTVPKASVLSTVPPAPSNEPVPMSCQNSTASKVSRQSGVLGMLEARWSQQDSPQDQVVSWNYKRETGEAATEGPRITEAQLGVMEHACRQFKQFDKDNSGHLNCTEIQRMLNAYNIYMLKKDVGIAICKFLRDSGMASPKDPMKAQMKLGEFIEFLFDIDDYLIAVPAHFHHPFSQALPPYKRWDLGAQWFFPVIVGLKILIFFAILDTYSNA